MLTRKMKDSGIEWIGEIPEDWNARRIKNILSERNLKNDPVITNVVLSLLKDRGVIPYSEKGNIGNKAKEDITKYKVAYPEDIIMNSMNVIIGSVNISRYTGVVSPVYYVLYVRNENEHDIDYINMLFQTKQFQESLKGIGNGILEHRMRIPINKLNDVILPFPSKKEQIKIVEILKRKTRKLDNIINETQQSIEELKKYKQSLITEAVTKGLDPNVEMKDSGIEWIGEIPDHWNFVKLGNISTKIGSGKTPRGGEDVYSQTGIYFLRSQNIYNEGLSLDTVRYITNDIHDEMSNTKVQHKDILLNITGGSIGRATIYDLIEEANVNQHVCIIRPKQDLVSSEWIHYCLISFLGKQYVNYFQTGGNREGLNFGEIAKFRIPLPKIEEQKIVSKRLKEQTSRIDKLIADKTKVIEELEDYKKSLIYEYVTGKKEV